jgi:hypothetical protein
MSDDIFSFGGDGQPERQVGARNRYAGPKGNLSTGLRGRRAANDEGELYASPLADNGLKEN